MADTRQLALSDIIEAGGASATALATGLASKVGTTQFNTLSAQVNSSLVPYTEIIGGGTLGNNNLINFGDVAVSGAINVPLASGFENGATFLLGFVGAGSLAGAVTLANITAGTTVRLRKRGSAWDMLVSGNAGSGGGSTPTPGPGPTPTPTPGATYNTFVVEGTRSNNPNQQGGTLSYIEIGEFEAYDENGDLLDWGPNVVASYANNFGMTGGETGGGNGGHPANLMLDGNLQTSAQFSDTAQLANGTNKVRWILRNTADLRPASFGIGPKDSGELAPGAFRIFAMDGGVDPTNFSAATIDLFSRSGSGDSGSNPVGYVAGQSKIFAATYPSGK